MEREEEEYNMAEKKLNRNLSTLVIDIVGGLRYLFGDRKSDNYYTNKFISTTQ